MVEETKKAAEEPVSLADQSSGDTPKQEKTIAEEMAAAKAKFMGTSEPSEPKKEVEEKTDGEQKEESVDDFLNVGEEKKDPVQRRIDQLVARAKAAEERAAELERKVGTDKEEKEPEYTPEQLDRAENKAIAENDLALLAAVNNQRIKQLEKKLRSDYEGEQKKKIDAEKRVAEEWNQVVKTYEYLADPNEEEIYQGSRQELNLRQPNSILYQVAAHLYNNPEPDVRKYYQQQGGQKLAVADALALIIRKRKSLVPKDSEAERLKKALAKERRKSSLGSGLPGEEQTEQPPAKVMTEQEKLSDYIEERKKLKDNPLKFIKG